MTEPTINLATLAAHFSDEGKAYELLESIRWPNGPVCPHCGAVDEATYLAPQGEGRKTRTGAVSKRRVWKCRACKKQFSVTVGTVFEGSKIPLPKWLLAVHLLCSAKNGVSAHELHRTLGVTYKTAWFMAHRIRYAMTQSPLREKLAGTVTADETWIGGKPHNMHISKRYRQDRPDNKTPVLTLVHRETGEARSRVIADVRGPTLRTAIEAQVDLPNTVLHTDNAMAYTKIGWKAREHHSVNHTLGEYVRGDVTTNHAENFFSQLKRSIDGTHHHVSREHLGRYLGEFDFRYSTRKITDGDRTRLAIEQAAGKRLYYRDPT
jgi:transposase-like protein